MCGPGVGGAELARPDGGWPQVIASGELVEQCLLHVSYLNSRCLVADTPAVAGSQPSASAR